MSGAQPSNARQRIAFVRPIDLPGSLRTFGRWGDDEIDRWDGRTLLRTMRVNGEVVPYAAQVTGTVARPVLELVATHTDRVAGSEIELGVRSTIVEGDFGLGQLASRDPAVARLARLYPGIVPVLVPDPFTALIRSISSQQVNLRWASTVRRRLAERYGTVHHVEGLFVYSLEPEPLAATTIEELRALQVTTAKSIAVIDSARAAQAGELDAVKLAAMNDDELVAHLTRLRGIGRWSAEWFLARTLGRPRVVAGDLGVRKAVARLYDTATLPAEDEVRRLTEHWGAAATVVQALALFELAESAGAA